VAAGVALAPAWGLIPAAADGPFDGSWTPHHHEAANPLDSRDWWLYVPNGLPDTPVPLVVYLHGCNQTAQDAAVGVRWNELADAEKFVVAYPEQRDPNEMEPGPDQGEAQLFGGNGSRCWNWFRPEQLSRESGEPSTIAAITRTVMQQQHIDPERVYLSGISAGGAMASVMGATHPDLYAAIAVLAGCGYRACGDTAGTAAFAAMGEHARPLPGVIVHGTTDAVAPLPMGFQALEQWRATNDLVDDGVANDSVPRTPAATQHVGADVAVVEGIGQVGDPCVRANSLPCLGGVVGLDEYPHTIDTWKDARGCELLQFWRLHGLGHAYSGGDPRGSFVDPLGPGETPIAWQFFQRHRRSGPTRNACEVGAGEDDPDGTGQVEHRDDARPFLPETGAGATTVGVVLLGLAVFSLRRRTVRVT